MTTQSIVTDAIKNELKNWEVTSDVLKKWKYNGRKEDFINLFLTPRIEEIFKVY